MRRAPTRRSRRERRRSCRSGAISTSRRRSSGRAFRRGRAQEEFFCGLDLAAPEGTAVVAPADGRVVFTGRARRDLAPRLWQFGTLVVIAHGPGLATLFGHLDRAEVRRGDAVKRGQRLGVVGKTGWALSPRVHYELWRLESGRLRPTDPLFAILDGRLDDRHRSLEQMRATSAPEPWDPLPGLP